MSQYIQPKISDRLVQLAKYLKTGPNWENALFSLFLSSLSCCAFVKSSSCSDPVIVLFQ